MAKKASKKRGPYKKRPRATNRDLEDGEIPPGTAGIIIQKLRLARGWTQEDLAEAAGLSKGTISGIEGGSSGFSKDSLPKLANALGVTIGGLFGVEGSEVPDSDFLAIWGRLKGPQRQRVQDFAAGVADRD